MYVFNKVNFQAQNMTVVLIHLIYLCIYLWASENLSNVNILLRELRPHLVVEDYNKLLTENAKESDFIYLDPPYSPVSPTANFTTYTAYGFNLSDQKLLAELFRKLDDRKCNILLSNSDTPYIRKLCKFVGRY